MDMNNVNIEEIVKQVLAGMTGTAPAASQRRVDHYGNAGHYSGAPDQCRMGSVAQTRGYSSQFRRN